jgi:hypothetical protein
MTNDRFPSGTWAVKVSDTEKWTFAAAGNHEHLSKVAGIAQNGFAHSASLRIQSLLLQNFRALTESKYITSGAPSLPPTL